MRIWMILAILAMAFAAPPLESQSGFSKVLPQSGPPDAMIQTSDGGYLFSSSVFFGSMDNRAWLIKMDAAGEIQWKKIFDSPHTLFDSIGSIYETRDGYIVVGSSSEIVKLDASGNVQWKRELKDSSGQHPHISAILQSPDETYLLAGAYDSSTFGNDILAARLDSSGNILWIKTYGGTGSDIGSSLAPGCDGGAFVLGYTDSFGAGQEDLLMLKINADGDLEWNKVMGRAGREFPISVVTSQDCGCFVLAQISIPGAPPYRSKPLVMKLNSAGDVVAKRTFGGPQFLNIIGHSILNDRGCVVVSDALMNQRGGDKALVLKLSPALNLNWSRLYRTPFGGYASTIAKAPGNGYLVGGHLLSNRITGAILTHLDPAGRNQACNVFRAEPITLSTPAFATQSASITVQTPALTSSNLTIKTTNKALPVSNCPFDSTD